jgi:hypothetical protein
MRRCVLGICVGACLAAGLIWQPGLKGPDSAQAQSRDEPAGKAKPGEPNQGGTGKPDAGSGRQAQNANLKPEPPPESAAAAGVPVLSNGDSYDDFASVVQTSDGTLYAAYAAYYDGHDQIRLHTRLPGGQWSTRLHVPLVRARADIWMPQLAVDAQDRVWVIWSEQTDQTRTASGNWDVYARAFEQDAWGPLVRLTDDPKPDINPHVATDAQHRIYVVWQGHSDNHGDVMLCRFDGQDWSKPQAVTSGPESDWYPQVALAADGTAWIAFDSYRNGDYDVFLTSVKGDRLGPVIPIATSKFYEAHPTVACSPDGDVWVAWEQGGYNWGKDTGYWLRFRAGVEGKTVPGTTTEAHPLGDGPGSSLGNTRAVKAAVYRGGAVLAAPGLLKVLPAEGLGVTAMPALAIGADGRVWLRFRRQNRGIAGTARRVTKYWTEGVSYLTERGWSKPVTLAGSTGRTSVFSRILPLADGGLAIAYSSDQRNVANYHQPIHDQVLVWSLAKPEDRPAMPELEPYQAPQPPKHAQVWDTAGEQAEVAAVRDYRTTIDGQEHRIVRGDLHRHTELSWDVGPGNDGSFLDFYRYMIDVASMDFGGMTDHQGGGQYAYHWWLIEKSADLYHLAPRFVPLYSYERSVNYPNGHRNVFHAYRGVPIFAFQIKLDQTGVFPGIGTKDVLIDDTKLLYQYLHQTGGLAISHTSGTDMGTDWRDNDPEIEPVVEIYQGARNSYEVIGAPRVHDISTMRPDQSPGGYEAAGMVWNALAKGYRLGNTSSSDHGSTHISYSLVYVPRNERQTLIDCIRKRQTYGATDNMLVEVRVGEHFMGQEFHSGSRPTLVLKVQGTGKIDRVDLVRNNRYIYATSPRKQTIELKYTDMEPDAGLNYYYFRVQQDDGEVAWASPVWIHYKPE